MSDVKMYNLINGNFIVTSGNTEIHTILGSCVSVCLWDPLTRVAGMNHFMVPGTPDAINGNPNQGYFSIHVLVNSMLKRGCSILNIEAKIFGGSNSLTPNIQYAIGTRNAAVADMLLVQYGIKILARHTGGHHGRKVIFNTATGKVKMKLLSNV
ncbi:chemoreceptor glutamine deamidase CheD [Fulvivirga kasyanovii]|uniref:Probable chemoreceptor glutamine deamidase CheD n=1 Tax=Fulvivirga kasyanovii TaxID=396812 RepID=A0ABW9RV84_9BACT|nr:chemotaxis protein CheD [Fulvivirga kasyanovii]MTI26915.1 chemotaxis protein CheD [Fulvivirga kasyanovii]